MNESVVQLRGITKTYRIGREITVNALRGVDLDVRPAEFVAIMVPSGSTTSSPGSATSTSASSSRRTTCSRG